jgi:hypothetical protein
LLTLEIYLCKFNTDRQYFASIIKIGTQRNKSRPHSKLDRHLGSESVVVLLVLSIMVGEEDSSSSAARRFDIQAGLAGDKSLGSNRPAAVQPSEEWALIRWA